MDSLPRSLRLLGVAVLVWPLWAFSEETANIFGRQDGLVQDLCSSTNTASGSANLSQWQSLGLCSEFCIGQDYAFAVMQYQSCWCSNVAPAEDITTDVSRCSEGCPGYGEVENCGRRPNLYGYMRLPRQPTSTYSGSATPTSTSTRSDDNDDDTTPIVSQTTITRDGTVRTIIQTYTPSADAGSAGGAGADQANLGTTKDEGLSTGAVVGIVVGVIAAVLVIAGLVLFCWFRRRRQRKDDGYDEPGSSQRGSSSGMIGSTRTPEMVVTGDQNSWVPDPTSEQRRSRLMAVDPRMDPQGRPMFLRNKSHESVNTIHDNQDYSRKVARPVLRATNPDPDT